MISGVWSVVMNVSPTVMFTCSSGDSKPNPAVAITVGVRDWAVVSALQSIAIAKSNGCFMG
jgi:hypothetical protein